MESGSGEIFWFHKYLILCCNFAHISTSVATKAKELIAHCPKHKGPVHGIAISIRHIALFQICDGKILCSGPIPLVTNTSAMFCFFGFRILAYLFTLNHSEDFLIDSKENWGIKIPTEVLGMILTHFMPKDLVSMAQASSVVEKWYYSSIPQIPGPKLHDFALSIPCCGKNTSDVTGVFCSICYSWLHAKCIGLSHSMPSETDEFTCPDCQGSRPCTSLEIGGIHRFYRERRERKACSVIYRGKFTEFRLRVSKPSSRRPELWLIRTHGSFPPAYRLHDILPWDIFWSCVWV